MRVQHEHVRRKAMNDYAELQILKLKLMVAIWVTVGLVWWLR